MTKKEYLLVCLMEECAEVSQAASKILRFGQDDSYTNKEGETYPPPEERLQLEVNDLRTVLDRLGDYVSLPMLLEQIKNKNRKLDRMMKYSRDKGILEGE